MISFAGDTLYPLTSRLSARPELVQSDGKQDQACDCVDARASAKKSPWRLAKTGDFEAPVAVREKEGERAFEGAHASRQGHPP